MASLPSHSSASYSSAMVVTPNRTCGGASRRRGFSDEHSGSWVVKIHPFSGHTFYHNRVTKVEQWENPMRERESLPALLDSEDNAKKRERLRGMIENLAGFNEVVDIAVFKMPKARSAIRNFNM
jgi:hypothetical protein